MGEAAVHVLKRTRDKCYACFDMAPGEKRACPVCGQMLSGARLSESERPARPPMNFTLPGKPQ